MKKLLVLLVAVLAFNAVSAQEVKVNGKELNEYGYIDLYTASKPFSSKESAFIDTGDNKFKKQNYDVTKNQRIYWNGKKLKSGNVLKIKKYLLINGWKVADKSTTELGNIKMNITTYIK